MPSNIPEMRNKMPEMGKKPFVHEVSILPDNFGLVFPFSCPIPMDHIVVGTLTNGKMEYHSEHKLKVLRKVTRNL